jgi:gluconate 5-dehydrogenase
MQTHTGYFERFSLAGRVALVTGAAGGIGQSIAQHLGWAGARVVVNDLDPDRCTQTVALLGESGVEALACPYDVTQSHAVEQASALLAQEGWYPDILVSNAGIQLRTPLEETPPDVWRRLIGIHVDGAYLHCRSYLPGMKQRGFGRVLVVGSITALAALPNQAAYTAAKGALAALVRSLAVDYGPMGITCNMLAPGATRTPLTRSLHTDPAFDSYIRSAVPAQRWGEPDDISAATVFLASTAASYINGHVLAIDGGWMARL